MGTQASRESAAEDDTAGGEQGAYRLSDSDSLLSNWVTSTTYIHTEFFLRKQRCRNIVTSQEYTVNPKAREEWRRGRYTFNLTTAYLHGVEASEIIHHDRCCREGIEAERPHRHVELALQKEVQRPCQEP